MSTFQKLVLDIETVGENFDSLDKATQESLTRWIKKESENEAEYEEALNELKNGLGFSALTAEIVAIGVLDCDRDESVVYFQAPDEKLSEFKEENTTFKQCSEKEMLEKFWEGAKKYNYFITFNGRTFDIPFMMVRSAVHGIKPTKDLMRGRYLSQQSFDAVHVDLLDQLTFYGAVRKKGNLHLWTRAFGITSPKVSGVTGDDVGKLFKEKKYAEIARYNAGDLRATKELHEKWENYMKF
ncbi:MAG: ribonuclease H-like domain-containing protein [Candidatus Liptonbacteria bacterium]|nr:ribonuclease H-like domain-containing protein [Candidatus Liptonbacteria bacterium]